MRYFPLLVLGIMYICHILRAEVLAYMARVMNGLPLNQVVAWLAKIEFALYREKDFLRLSRNLIQEAWTWDSVKV
jgi:hypothetical protein